jgi:hypothetical protein
MAHTLSRRKREELEQARRREEAEKFRNSTEAFREDGAALIEAWNARIAARMPMLTSPLIGPAMKCSA